MHFTGSNAYLTIKYWVDAASVTTLYAVVQRITSYWMYLP